MQETISRRFTICAVAVLGTTMLPWFLYNKVLGQKYELNFGLDLKGGASITYRVRAGEGQEQSRVLEDAIRVTRRRVDQFGVSEVDIKTSGQDQFTVELPGRGKEEIDRIKSIMRQTGSLEFRIAADPTMASSERSRKEREKEAYVPPPGYRWCPSEREGEMLLEIPDVRAQEEADLAEADLRKAQEAGKPEGELQPLRQKAAEKAAALEKAISKFRWRGEDLESSTYGRDPQGARDAYQVYFSIKAGRQSAFGDFTGDNIDRAMAIVLNDDIHSAPIIHGKLPGSGSIYNSARPFSIEQAQDLVTVLQSGSMQVKPEEVSSFVVGPGLGEEAVRRGRIAVLLSFVLVIAFMAVFYHGAGMVANLAVFLNLAMTVGVLMFLDAALSLPGIAGLLLTLGMAVDANILVNERIREEKSSGKGLLQAVAAGYDRAFITILDSNLTTIITAAILYWIGTGPIRGFALTLILGILISMFTALYVTRTLFLWGIEKGILTEFRMMRVFGRQDWDWMAFRAKFFAVSIALMALGAAAWALRTTESKYDLEFTGGQRVVIGLQARMSIPEVRARLEKAKLEGVSVRTIRGRGSDAEKMDLSTESDSYELTARIRDEEQGREYTGRIKEAFADSLVPEGIQRIDLGEKGATGRVPVTIDVNFATKDVSAEVVKETLKAGSTLFKEAEDLSVKKGEPRPGAEPFVVAAKVKASEARDLRLTIAEEIERAARRKEGVDLSEPIPQSDFIGPGVAIQFRNQAMLAVLLSIVAQIVYLRFRFRDFTYGFAAAIALVHDVVVTLGAVAVFDALDIVHVKVNLPVIASFLTLIGYSVNDTIVIFDRIRENLGRSVHPTAGLINNSINQTLARSIRTSVTVWLVAATLLLVNLRAGSSLEGFAFVMVVGVLAGSYSSIAIAAPLLLFLPVYFAELRRLGKRFQGALVLSLFGGLLLAIVADGKAALAGSLLSCVLPCHFLWHLIRWLPKGNPDALVKEAEAAPAAAAAAPAA